MRVDCVVRALGVLGLVVGLEAAAGEGPLAARDPWVAEAPPGATVMAAYLGLENQTDTDQVLVGVRSPAFESVEVHRSEVREGVARMVAVERLTIAPGATVRFEPGGYHLMLIAPRAPLRAGDRVSLTLVVEGGAEVPVSAIVRPLQPVAGEHSHHHHP
jgi:hypothetical protein